MKTFFRILISTFMIIVIISMFVACCDCESCSCGIKHCTTYSDGCTCCSCINPPEYVRIQNDYYYNPITRIVYIREIHSGGVLTGYRYSYMPLFNSDGTYLTYEQYIERVYNFDNFLGG